MDYFGPIHGRNFRKTAKKCISVFTCSSSKAILPKIVSTLDTEFCFKAIHRLIAERCYPKTFLSDNGTIYVEAAQKFRELFASWNGIQLEEGFLKLIISWTFNLPGVPLIREVCEHLVRPCKKAMRNILLFQTLKEEQLRTIICSVEHLFNNRPLTASGSDGTDLEAPIPKLFLF